MSKTKKSRKQEESSDDSDDSSTSEESSSDSSSEDRSHTRKHKKKSRKVKKRKLKKKSTHSDDIGSKEDLRQSKRSKKAEKHKKKRKHRDSDSDVQIEEHGKVLYISSGAEGDDNREKHYQRSKRLSELRMLRGADVHEKNYRSKWDSPADEREKQRPGNHSTNKYDEPDSFLHTDRYRRHDNDNFEFRQNYRNDEDGRHRQMDIGRRYEDDQRRYDRNNEIRRYSNEFVDHQESHTGRENRFDNNRMRQQGRDRYDFNNRSFNNRQGERRYGNDMQQRGDGDDRRRRYDGRGGGGDHHRDFNDRRRDERMESDAQGRRDGGGRVSRNPFDKPVPSHLDEPRREERGRINDNRYSDRNNDRSLKRERENSGSHRFDDDRRHKKSSNDRRSLERESRNATENQRIDKRDGRRDYERDSFHHRKGSHERRRPSSRSPVQQKNHRFRRNSNEDASHHEWGKKSLNSNENSKQPTQPIEKEKPNFGLSGKLTEDTNKVNGVVINYAEPPEARKPKRRWRLYPFKGEQSLQTFFIHRQSCFLIGRDRKICDIPVDHPSCSKQHAVLQYRLVPYEKEDGTASKRVRPYILDMNSANGTFVNNKQIESKKYVELLEKDVIKFGYSSREYVLLHENSKDDNLDDDVGNDDVHVKVEDGEN